MNYNLEEIQNLIRDTLLNDPFIDQISMPILRDAILEYPSRNSKAMRPALVIWTSGLFNSNVHQSVKVAAAIEIFHIWTLVHDDIIDEDDMRRGGKSIHNYIAERALDTYKDLSAEKATKYGYNLAILVGDVQQAWANKLIIDAVRDGLSKDLALKILYRLNQFVNPHLSTGEALDSEMEILPISDQSSDSIHHMMNLKTGRLFRFSAECGALIGLESGNFETDQVKKIGEFAENAGLAFQLKDDLLGMLGEINTLGKPIASDLEQGKRTFLFVTAAKKLNNKDSNYFLECLGKRNLTTQSVEKICELLKNSGAIQRVENQILEHIRTAEDLLKEFPDNRYRERLEEWLKLITFRNK